MSSFSLYPIFFAFVLWAQLSFAQFNNTRIENEPVSKTLNYKIKNRSNRFWEPPFVFGSHQKKWFATWAELTVYNNLSKKDSSFIYYSHSDDEGQTWQSTKRIGSLSNAKPDSNLSLKGAKGCLGPKGEVYIVWASPEGLGFQASLDNGKTWLPKEKTINLVKNGWEYFVNGSRSSGLPSIACDVSQRDHRGRLYVCWSDEKYGAKNKDVLLVYSDDQGQNWTEPILITYRPNNREQFKPAMAIDSSDGRLYVIYFDQQNYIDAGLTDLSLAVSDNGGLLFEIYPLNEKPLPINANCYLNTNIVLTKPHQGQVFWTVTDETKTSTFKATISDTALNAYQESLTTDALKIEKTFPFQDQLKISFSLSSALNLGAVITKPLDPGFEKQLFPPKYFAAGDHSFLIDTKKIDLQKGNYVLTLYYNGRNTYVWLLEN